MASRKRTVAQQLSETRVPTGREGRSVVSRARLWDELLPSSRAHVEFQYIELLRRASKASNAHHNQALRAALSEGLRDHIQLVSQDGSLMRSSARGTALPVDMAKALLEALEAVSSGEPVPLFTPERVSGGRGNLRKQAKQVGVDWAVHYVTAAQLKWIRDRSARARVSRLYGVSLRQVERWVADAGPTDSRENALDTWAVHLGLTLGVEGTAGKALAKLLPAMGERYRG